MPEILRAKFERYRNMKGKDSLDTPYLVRNALKLGMAIAGQNISDYDKKTIKFASPRFFSIVPDDSDNNINLLSPSLFSLHDEGREEEKNFSIPHLLKNSKLLQKQDHQELIDLIAEATGITDAVEDAENLKKSENMKGIDGQPMYFTKENATEIYGDDGRRRIETFERLHKSLNAQQIKEMNATGYSIMNKKQLYLLYGKDSPYASESTLKKLASIKSLEELQRHIEHDISVFSKHENLKLQ
ncbi:unnamed protein product, partial [Enterobius vermicularis]|uniref:DdrB-ParB domain-containing protein n=1 Tax=Enterobius vermicularis TaxID=51028 RepID=A0A0N4VEH7_ENTVE